MIANPEISLAHLVNVSLSCVIVLLKLMYLKIYKKRRIIEAMEEPATTDFDPSKKDGRTENNVELILPVAEEGEVIVLSVVFD